MPISTQTVDAPEPGVARLISGLFFYGLTTVLTTTGRNFVLLVVWADKCDDHYRQTPIKCSRSFPVRKILVSDDGQTSARSTPRRTEHAWISCPSTGTNKFDLDPLRTRHSSVLIFFGGGPPTGLSFEGHRRTRRIRVTSTTLVSRVRRLKPRVC